MRRSVARLLFCLAAVFFLGFGLFLKQVAREAKPAEKSGISAQEVQAPTSIALLSAFLGSFRTLLVDFLWIRAQDLQDRGEYFASAEIARWITALQSKVDEGWSFQAWNLAVNVPSALPEEKRWPYVEAGIELLWKKALRANPTSLSLYYDLCWLWAYRIGADLDSAAPRYRKIVKSKVRRILGPPPYNLGEFIEAHSLLARLRSQKEVVDFWNMLKEYGIQASENGWIELLPRLPKLLGEKGNEVLKLLEEDPILRYYDKALRAETFQKTFGLSISDIDRAYKRYGDIGINDPESFVVFWATKGLSLLEKEAVRLDALSLWRMRFRALRRLFLRGRPLLARRIDRDYREIVDLVSKDPYFKNQAQTFTKDRRQFLRTALTVLFLQGHRAEAEQLWPVFRDLEKDLPQDITLEDFVFGNLITDLVPERASRYELEGVLRALVRSSLKAYERGEEEEASLYISFARDLRRSLLKEFDPRLVPDLNQLISDLRKREKGRKEFSKLGKR